MSARKVSAFAFALAACVAFGTPLPAQQPATWDAGRLQLTRPELELLLQKFEQAGVSPSYSEEFKLRARREAQLVRERLRDGDFQIGDQIELNVEGESGMPLTLPVQPGHMLIIPSFGELSVAGVLRSELNEHMRTHIARFVRSPKVQTRSLIRLAVIGQVARPGYFMLPAESLVSDAIMSAGGPTPNAKIASARVERGLNRIWEGKVLQQAVADGRTLDQMSLRSGDQLVLPADGGSWTASLLRTATLLPAALIAITGLIAAL